MAANIGAQLTIRRGERRVVQSVSPVASHAVVFEDDGETGYFYGLDIGRKEAPILDSLHVYSVAATPEGREENAADEHLVQILWSEDGLKAGLTLDRELQAVFDFEAKRGYCKTGRPAPDTRWTAFGHAWDDGVIELFRRLE